MYLIYNKETETWNVISDEQATELLKINNDGTAQMFLPNGTSTTVTLDANGLFAANQLIANNLFFAAR